MLNALHNISVMHTTNILCGKYAAAPQQLMLPFPYVRHVEKAMQLLDHGGRIITRLWGL